MRSELPSSCKAILRASPPISDTWWGKTLACRSVWYGIKKTLHPCIPIQERKHSKTKQAHKKAHKFYYWSSHQNYSMSTWGRPELYCAPSWDVAGSQALVAWGKNCLVLVCFPGCLKLTTFDGGHEPVGNRGRGPVPRNSCTTAVGGQLCGPTIPLSPPMVLLLSWYTWSSWFSPTHGSKLLPHVES